VKWRGGREEGKEGERGREGRVSRKEVERDCDAALTTETEAESHEETSGEEEPTNERPGPHFSPKRPQRVVFTRS